MRISRPHPPIRPIRLEGLGHGSRASRDRDCPAAESSPSGTHQYSPLATASPRCLEVRKTRRHRFDRASRRTIGSRAGAERPPSQHFHLAKPSAREGASGVITDHRTVERPVGLIRCQCDPAWFRLARNLYFVDHTAKKNDICILEMSMQPPSLHSSARAGSAVPTMRARTSSSLDCDAKLQTGTNASHLSRGCTGGLCVCH